MAIRNEWRGFKGVKWLDEVNVRDFIQNNYTQYDGDESFLTGPTEATNILWGKLQELQKAAGMEPSPVETWAQNKALFGTPQSPILLLGVEKETEEEPMTEEELEDGLREIREEGLGLLNPTRLPEGEAVRDETPWDLAK